MIGSVFPVQYLNNSAEDGPVAKSTWSGGFSFEKHFVAGHFTNQRNKCTSLTSAPQRGVLLLSSESSPAKVP